jgi:hypothetical protein
MTVNHFKELMDATGDGTPAVAPVSFSLEALAMGRRVKLLNTWECSSFYSASADHF